MSPVPLTVSQKGLWVQPLPGAETPSLASPSLFCFLASRLIAFQGIMLLYGTKYLPRDLEHAPSLTCGLQFLSLGYEWLDPLTCRSPWAMVLSRFKQ